MKAIAAILDAIPGWLWALVCAGMLAFGVTQSVRLSDARVELADNRVVSQALRADIEKLMGDAATQRAMDENAARNRERELINFYAEQEKAKDEQIDRLRSDVRTLRAGLQQLPKRSATPEPNGSAGNPAAANQAPAVQCDGPILYQEDGGLLVDEAERAETIRLELLNLYELYDKARQLKQQ